MRARLLAVTRRIIAGLLELCLVLLPRRGHVVVYGLPGTEGNAVETVRALLHRYDGTVYWLDAPSRSVLASAGLGDAARLRVLPRLGVAAVWRYLTADIVFFTHGLYGNPAPPARRLAVNLWHGDGIKVNDTRMRSRSGAAAASYVVGSTSLLTARKATDLGLDPARAVITGNPRTDQLSVAPGADALARLGLPVDAPFVVWMPTFRTARQSGVTAGWADTAGGSGLGELMAVVAAALAARGVALAVRLHPLDAESHPVAGAVTLSDTDLEAAGTLLYALLGAASGLISDYSSVVTDFLLLDRPIGFLVPDRAAYLAGRGVYPADAMSWLPGPVLATPADVTTFTDDIVAGGRAGASARAAARDRLGLVTTTGAADALLTELARREAARGRPLTRLHPPKSTAEPREKCL